MPGVAEVARETAVAPVEVFIDSAGRELIKSLNSFLKGVRIDTAEVGEFANCSRVFHEAATEPFLGCTARQLHARGIAIAVAESRISHEGIVLRC